MRAANLDSNSLLAPIQTSLPDLNISAVVCGDRILMITALNRLGLYSAFLAFNAISFKFNSQHSEQVLTTFLFY